MFTKRAILILVVYIFSVFRAGASLINYDDVYSIVLSGDKDRAYTLLMAYQKQDPDFSNTYFQLAIIAKEWTYEFNPFTEFSYTKQFIYNTKLYFNLAMLKLEDDKKKNRMYYENVIKPTEEKKITNEDINLYIKNQLDSIEIYETNILRIINYFNKSSDFYNECVNLFMSVNTDYVKIKNIYLSDDEEFIESLNTLETKFDSVIYNLSEYKKAIEIFPIKNYNQNYKLKPIITYRLDGLTNSNFLNNNITLWDYKKWVQQVKDVKNQIINSNRNEISEEDKKLKKLIEAISEENYTDSLKTFDLDKKFVYKIEKYDNNSLLILLFKINEAQINFLQWSKKSINNPELSERVNIEKSIAYVNQLIEKKIYADSLRKEFLNALKAEEIFKYKEFYLNSYNGMGGIKDYVLRQDLSYKEIQKQAFEILKNRLVEQILFEFDSLYLNKKAQKAVFKPSKINQAVLVYNILDFCKFENQQQWVSGYITDEKSKSKGFIAFLKDSSQIKFIKHSINSDTTETYYTVADLFSEGAVFIETTIANKITNSLKKYDKLGMLLFEKEIPVHKIPRKLFFDEINNTANIIFNGEQPDVLISSDDRQIFYQLNIDDDTQSFELEYKAAAIPFDIIKNNDNLLIFSNFSHFTNVDNQTIYSGAGKLKNETNVLVTVISNREIKKFKPMLNRNSFWGTKAVKINSNLINISGFKSEFKNYNKEELKNKELFYALINANTDVLFDGWHD